MKYSQLLLLHIIIITYLLISHSNEIDLMKIPSVKGFSQLFLAEIKT